MLSTPKIVRLVMIPVILIALIMAPIDTSRNIRHYIYIYGLKALPFDPNMRATIPWSDEPLEVVIPIIEKDLATLPDAVAGIRKNLMHPLGNIYIVAPDSPKIRQAAMELGCELILEDKVLPITIKDIHTDRPGWWYQQLLKLYADTIVKTQKFLVLDADTVLIKPQAFVRKGKTIFYHSDEYNWFYFDFYSKLLNERPVSHASFIAHHMIFDKEVLSELRNEVEKIHGKEWYQAIFDIYKTGIGTLSEYETYANFYQRRYPEKMRKNYWYNKSFSQNKLKSLDYIKNSLAKTHKSVSFHSWIK